MVWYIVGNFATLFFKRKKGILGEDEDRAHHVSSSVGYIIQ